MANQTGKRYVCSKCGSEFIVTKGGDGAVACCQTPMELKSALKQRNKRPLTQCTIPE